jgi:mannose-6-phosphate isomerase-like protein (cupin superfamily)
MTQGEQPARARIISPEDAPTKQLRYNRGSVVRFVDAEIGAKQVDLHLNTIYAGSAPGPYHLHEQVENVYYVIEGDVVIRIDGEDHRVQPGSVVFIPPGIPHSATNVGDTDARLLEIYAPVNVDFVEVEDRKQEDTP